MRQRPLLLSLLLAAQSAVGAAQTPDTAVKLVVTLDRSDWLYSVGDTARFTVSLLRSGRPVPNARARVSFGLERMPPMRVDTVDVGNGSTTLKGALGARHSRRS